MAHKDIYIFWSGGWDSTYRMCELARQDVTVHPVYLVIPKRLSTNNELRAIAMIYKKLMRFKGRKADIRQPRIIRLEEVPYHAQIEQAYYDLEEYKFPEQYLYLAVCAVWFPGIELCFERYSKRPGSMSRMLSEKGRMVFDGDGVGHIDKAHSEEAVVRAWGNFSFPVIRITEQQMLENIKAWRMEKFMKDIVFCRHDVLQPCGYCPTCIQKMEKGMYFLFSQKAIRRYEVFRYFVDRIKACPGLSDEERTVMYDLLHVKFDTLDTQEPSCAGNSFVRTFWDSIDDKLLHGISG